MSCERWQASILEAEPAELRGDIAGELARHLTDCDACRALARAILEEQASLGAILRQAALLRPVDAEVVVGRARLSAAPARTRFRRAIIVAATAAAAAAALLMVRPERRTPSPAPASMGEQAARPRPLQPLVDAPPGGRVAVLRTSNPKITVVWYF